VTFLKHIEKTKVLLHCIDSANDDPKKTYETVRKEFEQYNEKLLDKPEIILITKTDLVDAKKVSQMVKMFEKKNQKVLTCSIYDPESIEALKQTLEKFL